MAYVKKFNSQTRRALGILRDRIQEGTIRTHGDEYIGRAGDGVEVSLGSLSDLDSMLSYLLTHPTPDTW